MGTGADAEIWAVAPVGEIVLGMVTGFAPVGDFIVLISSGLEPVHRHLVHRGRQIVIRPRRGTRADVSVKRRAFLNLQPVEREVFGLERNRPIECQFPIGSGSGSAIRT